MRQRARRVRKIGNRVKMFNNEMSFSASLKERQTPFHFIKPVCLRMLSILSVFDVHFGDFQKGL